MGIMTNSRFSRTVENEAKMGAYYTNLAHCKDIGKMFIWPEDEVSVLEPSIGDASAVITATNAANNSNIKIFGVELNDEVAKQTASNPFVEAVLKADFTNGIMVRKNAFSFCFANPPYLNDKGEEGNSRLEKQFLERIVNYLKASGILVWIVPFKQFFEMGHLRMWMKNFDTLAIYKFREDEYKKFSQIVVVGKRVPHSISAEDVEGFINKHFYSLEELPNDLQATISVPVSPSSGVDLFTTRFFDATEAYKYLETNGLSPDISAALERRISVKKFSEGVLKRPPIPVKNDSLFLLVASGVGQGYTGSEEDGTLHLQRGVAEVVEESFIPSSDDEYEDEESGTANRMIVTTRTSVKMTVLENDGTIHVLA